MDFNEGMDHLSKWLKGHDWFYDIGTDSYGRYVVYVKFMNHETLHDIPDTVSGKQVVVHFAGSMQASKEQFTIRPLSSFTSGTLPPPPEDTIVSVEGSISGASEDKSLRHLQNELDRLEKACGSHALQDIFYEAHDGKNAVTNVSKNYSDVRKSMDKLLQEYGFDVIYEELDG